MTPRAARNHPRARSSMPRTTARALLLAPALLGLAMTLLPTLAALALAAPAAIRILSHRR